MEISKVYQANSERLFDLLRESFKTDYQTNTKKPIKIHDIKPGLKFTKLFGSNKQNSVLVEVEKMTFPSHYRIKLNSSRGTNVIEYLIEPQSEQEIAVTYREEYLNVGVFTKLNNMVLSPFFKKKLERRMTDQMDHLIEYSNLERTQHAKKRIS